MTNKQLALVMLALCLAVFCQALDTTIIATAIPSITTEFNSLDDVGWYGSSYLLANCSFLLLYGKLYNLFPVHWVFLVALGIFELGSLVCGVTPTSVGLIIGRAIQGIGAGGILSGATLIIAALFPLDKRPMYQGSLGSMYALASVAGPLLGGVITEYVTWRLCFYINLPIGLVAAVIIVAFTRGLKAPDSPTLSFREKVMSLDPFGILLFLPMIICLLLAIMWGGSTYPWSNARIIVLFVLGGLLLIGFVWLQVHESDRAMVPLSVARDRTVWASCVFSFFLFGSLLVLTYYLPIWFQAIKGSTASESGIRILPLLLGSVVLSLVGGVLVSVNGYYTWLCILSSVLVSVGSGLMTTFKPSSGIGKWIGYQAIYGAGIGFGMQQPLIAIQAALPEKQVAEGTSLIIFIQTFGGAILLSVGQSLFTNSLVRNVAKADLPLDPSSLLSGGATNLDRLIAPEYLEQLREAYNDAIIEAFYAAVATAALSLIGSVFMPWFSVKKVKQQREAAKAEAAEAPKDKVDGTSSGAGEVAETKTEAA
ncbi:DHA14-like major facilitator [Akanthomyces lecanii RCEF 1005]|uniref:DHA14-like major facilitator n=1 Tax=Akanthomyces lecanii RCEF 1005 TaxID=1081108 RepID=A0A168GM04_CORDF|nr:DHA14-like major facilitator [Akanthomyces lecanii RCEF 1005]